MISWHTRVYGEWIATDVTGRVIGAVSLLPYNGLYRVSGNSAHGDYISLAFAKDAVERATKGEPT